MAVAPVNLLRRLERSGETLAVAESLTGGLLTNAFITVPGASTVVRGGVIAYATDLKNTLLGVDADLLAQRGAVDGQVAEQMAAGVRSRLGATYGLSTTGVAGPDPQDGHEVGTVYLGLAHPGGCRHARVHLVGDRSEIRAGSVVEALQLLAKALPEA